MKDIRKEFDLLKHNMNAWVINLRQDIGLNKNLDGLVNENVGNIQHNYELIQELKDQFDELKNEVNALKLMQLMNLREKG